MFGPGEGRPDEEGHGTLLNSSSVLIPPAQYRANRLVAARHGAGDLTRRRIEGRREMQWIENGTEFRRRLFALMHKNRANHQNVWAGGRTTG